MDFLKLFSKESPSKSSSMRYFKSIIGMEPLQVSAVWEEHLEGKEHSFTKLHLLYTLSFLKVYENRSSNVHVVGIKNNDYFTSIVFTFMDYLYIAFGEVSQ